MEQRQAQAKRCKYISLNDLSVGLEEFVLVPTRLLLLYCLHSFAGGAVGLFTEIDFAKHPDFVKN